MKWPLAGIRIKACNVSPLLHDGNIIGVICHKKAFTLLVHV